MSLTRAAILAASFTITLFAAGPLDFGKAELNAALAPRNQEPALLHLLTEISGDPNQSYRIEANRIFGGDIRGLMYGLLEAADQIRTTGKLSPAQGLPSSPIRGIRATYQPHPAAYWEAYVRTLARNRFNRLNMLFTAPPNAGAIDQISQLASEHAIDFTLTLEGPQDLAAILTRCKGVRAIHLQSNPAEAIAAIQSAGRLINLEIENTQSSPALAASASAAGIPLHRLPKRILSPNGDLLWGDPDYLRRTRELDGFEIDLPADYERHWMAYLLWGRLTYDPKTSDKVWLTELQRHFGSAAPDMLEAYRNTTVQLPTDPSPFVATTKEAVHNRVHGIASAKQTPLTTAVHLHRTALNLERAAERLKEWPKEQSDFLAIAGVAKYYGRKLLAEDQLEAFDQTGADSALYAAQREFRAATRQWETIGKYTNDPAPPNTKAIDEKVKKYEQSEHKESPMQRWPNTQPRPAMEHVPPVVAITGQPLSIDLKLPHKYRVRLYHNGKILENESGHFTLTPESDLTYYFEILNNQGTGWFQPDPQTSYPYYTVKVQPPSAAKP